MTDPPPMKHRRKSKTASAKYVGLPHDAEASARPFFGIDGKSGKEWLTATQTGIIIGKANPTRKERVQGQRVRQLWRMGRLRGYLTPLGLFFHIDDIGVYLERRYGV